MYPIVFPPLLNLSLFSPFWAAAPKGPMTYALTHMGDFLLFLLLLLLLLRPPPREAQILASRLKSQP